MSDTIDLPRLTRCYELARTTLLAWRNERGHWTGELSTSPLSTATAVVALELVRRHQEHSSSAPRSALRTPRSLIDRGLVWLAAHQNPDGGWGDTTKSLSNISTTMLAHAAFHAAAQTEPYAQTVTSAKNYIDRAGGVPALVARYGKDRTFSVPILTHCALAGLVDWRDITPLPFELACLPARFYKTVRLPVVSYALPALIAIGQVRHHHAPTHNPLTRYLRNRAAAPSLRVLEGIQPPNGGFLEATPLTSFVAMSLAGMGLADHPVARRGADFLINSVRPDGSWPIDTNLATWVTTLAVNALADDLPPEARPAIRDWLLAQQYRTVHPYTNADPGGWAWTNLPGGVPDADDTPGAVLALLTLSDEGVRSQESGVCKAASLSNGQRTTDNGSLSAAIHWLLDLQNRDGGWPTFCRGWGALPFDRSAPDLTAHALRALVAWLRHNGDTDLKPRAERAIARGFRYLAKTQRPDGSWLPLWFGNQHNPDDENPVYGTARVLAAYRDARRLHTMSALHATRYLIATQHPSGAWGALLPPLRRGGQGGARGTPPHAPTAGSPPSALSPPPSIEETALATEALLAADPYHPATARGVNWLMDRVDDGTFIDPAPIGFYFAKLWYFESLYPLVFLTGALRTALHHARATTTPEYDHPPSPPPRERQRDAV